MKKVLVTGGKGQLASSIKKESEKYNELGLTFIDIDELDITNGNAVSKFFSENEPDYCVNCAAYTAVDKAETEKDNAFQINVNGAKILAQACQHHNAILIQLSTDYIFAGDQCTPYTELVTPNPLGVYGETKWQGEQEITNDLDRHIIIRTSWLYSEYGNNFMKTMLRLGRERESINVIADQFGTPTYAGDLAEMILKMIDENFDRFGTYHYSNEGVASWYDFAKAIFSESRMDTKVVPIKTGMFPTPARRPAFSILDKTKIKEELNIEIPYWRDSLIRSLKAIHEN